MKTAPHFVVVLGLVLCGCQAPSGSSTPAAEFSAAEARLTSGAAGVRDNAYSLLLELLNEERNVSKLLVVKRDSRELNRLIQQVSTVSGAAADELERLAKSDPTLVLTATQLPPGEVATRKAIAATKTKELLKDSADGFERALLLTQIEALSYAGHLAEVGADHDAVSQRAAWARSVSRQLKELEAECVALLTRRPHGP